jgi:hypothetical protein
MLMGRSDLHRRAEEYAERKELVIEQELGSGVHGIVFAVASQDGSRLSAIKVHERAEDYARERDVYLQLSANRVVRIRGANVPELLAFDDALWIIEMTIVTRPFVLDFAGAYLDQPPDYSEEVWADWEAEKREQFGSQWPEVQAILRALEGYGIFMMDVNPGNISLGA